MSGNTNPNVVTDDLILCLDSYNEQSYLGEPTVNLMTNPTFQNKTAGSSSAWGWGTGYSGTVYYLEDNPPKGDLYFGLYCSTPNVWMEHAQLTNLTVSTTYKLSYWIRATPDSGTYWNTIYVYALTDSVAVLSQGVACGGTWVRHTTQFTTRSTTQNYRIASYNYTAGMTLYISGIQIEEKSHVTKFVSGTRSATDGWKDLSGSDNHADLTQVSYSSTNVPGTNVNNFSFDGTDDYCDLPTLASGSVKTILAWIKNTGGSSSGIVFCPHVNGLDSWFGIESYLVHVYATQSADTNNFYLYGTTTMSVDTWYQIGVTIDYANKTVKCYLNGVQDGSVTRTHTIGDWGGGAATIGRRGTLSQRQFDGEISNCLIYNEILTATEILQNYNAHKARFGL